MKFSRKYGFDTNKNLICIASCFHWAASEQHLTRLTVLPVTGTDLMYHTRLLQKEKRIQHRSKGLLAYSNSLPRPWIASPNKWACKEGYTVQGVSYPSYVISTTGGLPLKRKSLTRFPLPRFLAYVRASGGFSVSRGPQYSPTNTNFM